MKRSMQEIVELVVFGLIAVLIATGVLWLFGWIFGLVGAALLWLSGLIWALLRFIVPVAVVAAIVYLIVRLVQQGRNDRAETSTYAPAPTEHAASTDHEAAPAASTPTSTTVDPGPAAAEDGSANVGHANVEHATTEPKPERAATPPPTPPSPPQASIDQDDATDTSGSTATPDTDGPEEHRER